MKMLLQLATVAVLAHSSMACSIKHPVANDYGQYLNNNQGVLQLNKVDQPTTYSQTDTTQQHKYEFRSAMAGWANVWVVEFGKILDYTMASDDVKRAFTNLQKSDSGDDLHLAFDLKSYTFTDTAAHVTVDVSALQNGQTLWSKTYQASGKSQGGKMFWGGVFAMKNAVQQSTKLAIDQILKNLTSDLAESKTASIE